MSSVQRLCRRVAALVGVGVALLAVPAAAEIRGLYSAPAERHFERGLAAYTQADYAEARRRFEAIGELPRNQRSSAGALMLARSLYQLGEYRLALQVANDLERDFGGSRYVADARLVAGDCLYGLRRYYEAATQYGRILAMPAPLPLQGLAAERLAAIAGNRTITAGAMDQLRLQVGTSRLRDALAYGTAAWYERLGWVEQSRQAAAAYADSLPDGVFRPLLEHRPVQTGAVVVAVGVGQGLDSEAAPPLAEALPAGRPGEVTYGHRGGPRLGVLVPLSGAAADRRLGQDLLDGVRLANEELGEPFEVVAVDVGYDYGNLPITQSAPDRLMQVVLRTRHLADELGVLAIVGPVYSDACVAAAAVAEARGVPLLAPLAQQSGLDTLGQYVFQLNVIPDTQGEALAEYATLVMGLETLAILTPLSDYGWSFHRAFTRAASANGARVVESEWYYPGQTTDYKVQFEAIRQAGFPLMGPATTDTLAVLDSLSLSLVDTSMATDGTFLEALAADSALNPAESPDSTEIFVDSIDGIALVVEYFDDAKTIAPQLQFHRLRTQMLGNDVWSDAEAIRNLSATERQYLRGCAFVSRRGGESESARRFTDAYRARFGRDPGFAAFSYDAARLAMAGYQEGHHTRAALRDWLAGVRNHDGASGRISFPPGRRANGEIGLLKIDARGRVRPLTLDDLPKTRTPGDLADGDLWEGWDLEPIPPVDRGAGAEPAAPR
ncbi:MAG: ABC transporter substrate-binding protein [Gemmatimonadota bacterium]